MATNNVSASTAKNYKPGDILTKEQLIELVGIENAPKMVALASKHQSSKMTVYLNDAISIDFHNGIISISDARKTKGSEKSTEQIFTWNSEDGLLENGTKSEFSHPALSMLWSNIKQTTPSIENKVEAWAAELSVDKHDFLERFLSRVLSSVSNNQNDQTTVENSESGSVYVLFNPSMPNLVKIGQTKRSPEERAKEISSSTGVPVPFVVAYEASFHDCREAEHYIHQLLEAKGYRISPTREFFELPLKDAIDAVIEARENLTGDNDAVDSNKQTRQSASDNIDKFIDNILDEANLFFKTPADEIFEEAEAYHYGLGDKLRNHKKAFNLYYKSLQLGGLKAYRKLAEMYEVGEGTSKSSEKSFELYSEGAEKGAVECYPPLALIYQKQNDLENAKKCWNRYFANVEDADFLDIFSYLSTHASEYGFNEKYAPIVSRYIVELYNYIFENVQQFSEENQSRDNSGDSLIDGLMVQAKYGKYFDAFKVMEKYFPVDEDNDEEDVMSISEDEDPKEDGEAADTSQADEIREKSPFFPFKNDPPIAFRNGKLVFPHYSVGTLVCSKGSQSARGEIDVSTAGYLKLKIQNDISEFGFLKNCDPDHLITHLDISNSIFFGREQLKLLSSLQSLKHLDISSYSQNAQDDGLGDSDVMLAKLLHSVMAFKGESDIYSSFSSFDYADAALFDTPTERKGYSVLLNNPELKSLAIVNRELDELALKEISQLSGLEYLDIHLDRERGSSFCKDDSFRLLLKLTQLKELNISGYSVLSTQRIIELATKLPNLMKLEIEGCNISDFRIEEVKEMRGNLEIIHETRRRSLYPY